MDQFVWHLSFTQLCHSAGTIQSCFTRQHDCSSLHTYAWDYTIAQAQELKGSARSWMSLFTLNTVFNWKQDILIDVVAGDRAKSWKNFVSSNNNVIQVNNLQLLTSVFFWQKLSNSIISLTAWQFPIKTSHLIWNLALGISTRTSPLSLSIPIDQILPRLITSLQLNQVKNKNNNVVSSVS